MEGGDLGIGGGGDGQDAASTGDSSGTVAGEHETVTCEELVELHALGLVQVGLIDDDEGVLDVQVGLLEGGAEDDLDGGGGPWTRVTGHCVGLGLGPEADLGRPAEQVDAFHCAGCQHLLGGPVKGPRLAGLAEGPKEDVVVGGESLNDAFCC